MRRLRDATREAHARIETSLPLLDPELTQTTYIRVIEAFHGFYAPLEPRLVGATEIQVHHQAKTPLLVADLLALGLAPEDVDALPRCTQLPRVMSTAHLVGVLYVLEGATLGGHIIGRHLRDRLAIQGDNGGAFFGGYGSATGRMWTRFSDRVDSAPALDTESAVSAAIETFETLRVWLDAALFRPH